MLATSSPPTQRFGFPMLGFRTFTVVAGDMLVLAGAGLLVIGWEMWMPATLTMVLGTLALLGALTLRND